MVIHILQWPSCSLSGKRGSYRRGYVQGKDMWDTVICFAQFCYKSKISLKILFPSQNVSILHKNSSKYLSLYNIFHFFSIISLTSSIPAKSPLFKFTVTLSCYIYNQLLKLITFDLSVSISQFFIFGSWKHLSFNFLNTTFSWSYSYLAAHISVFCPPLSLTFGLCLSPLCVLAGWSQPVLMAFLLFLVVSLPFNCWAIPLGPDGFSIQDRILPLHSWLLQMLIQQWCLMK